jgi:hypothetical protein
VDETAASSIIETDSDTLPGILNGNINPMEAWSDGLMRADKSLDALARIIPACIAPVDL